MMRSIQARGTPRQVTVGVLGHVDHGKTALVLALTGIETDRLAEERERGLSIVAGYAFIETPEASIDLIDVPGHQAFIRAMIGAASGVHAALLVVAANEGVMPQTREHLAIAGLLGVDKGIIVLSKCDLADETVRSVCEDEIRELVAPTFLRDAPVIRVAATRGEGIPELQEALLRLGSHENADAGVPFFMPVDRSFSLSGFGRVVTGTVQAGTVSRGEELFVSPGEERVSVRGIQVHGHDVEMAGEGARAALNLRTANASIPPGAIVGAQYAVRSSRRLDVLIEPLPEHVEAFRNGVQLRVLIGTTDAQVRLRVLEREAKSKTDSVSVLAQLRCDREICARPDMRFVLRKNSPAETVGGGIVIDASAPRRRRFARETNDLLSSAAGAAPATILAQIVDTAGLAGLDRDEAALRLCVAPETIDELAEQLRLVAVTPQIYCARKSVERLETRILETLNGYHESHPQHAGMRQVELFAAIGGGVHEALMRAACGSLAESSQIVAVGDAWRLASFDQGGRLNDSERKMAERIEAIFLKSGIASQSLAEIVSQMPAARETLRYLIDTGRVVRLQTRDRKDQRALHADTIADVQARIRNRYPCPAEFAVSDIRDLFDTTRKHVVPLLEHLDATGFTLRKGDMRQIRQ